MSNLIATHEIDEHIDGNFDSDSHTKNLKRKNTESVSDVSEVNVENETLEVSNVNEVLNQNEVVTSNVSPQITKQNEIPKIITFLSCKYNHGKKGLAKTGGFKLTLSTRKEDWFDLGTLFLCNGYSVDGILEKEHAKFIVVDSKTYKIAKKEGIFTGTSPADVLKKAYPNKSMSAPASFAYGSPAIQKLCQCLSGKEGMDKKIEAMYLDDVYESSRNSLNDFINDYENNSLKSEYKVDCDWSWDKKSDQKRTSKALKKDNTQQESKKQKVVNSKTSNTSGSVDDHIETARANEKFANTIMNQLVGIYENDNEYSNIERVNYQNQIEEPKQFKNKQRNESTSEKNVRQEKKKASNSKLDNDVDSNIDISSASASVSDKSSASTSASTSASVQKRRRTSESDDDESNKIRLDINKLSTITVTDNFLDNNDIPNKSKGSSKISKTQNIHSTDTSVVESGRNNLVLSKATVKNSCDVMEFDPSSFENNTYNFEEMDIQELVKSNNEEDVLSNGFSNDINTSNLSGDTSRFEL